MTADELNKHYSERNPHWSCVKRSALIGLAANCGPGCDVRRNHAFAHEERTRARNRAERKSR